MEEMISQYLLQGILTIVTLILTGAYTRLSKKFMQQKEESEATKLGVRAVLHKECQRLMEQNRVSTEELKNVERIYENYHKLGGNGTGTALYERILKLPIDDGKDDE